MMVTSQDEDNGEASNEQKVPVEGLQKYDLQRDTLGDIHDGCKLSDELDSTESVIHPVITDRSCSVGGSNIAQCNVGHDRGLAVDDIPGDWTRGFGHDPVDRFEDSHLNEPGNLHSDGLDSETNDSTCIGYASGFVRDLDLGVFRTDTLQYSGDNRSDNGQSNCSNHDAELGLLEHEIITSYTSPCVIDKISNNTGPSSYEHIESIILELLLDVCHNHKNNDEGKRFHSYTSVNASDLLSCSKSLEQVFLVDNTFDLSQEQTSRICICEKCGATNNYSWQRSNENKIQGKVMFEIESSPNYANLPICTTCQHLGDLGSTWTRPAEADSSGVYNGTLLESKLTCCHSLHVGPASACVDHSRQFEKSSSTECNHSSAVNSSNSYSVGQGAVNNPEELTDLSICSTPLDILPDILCVSIEDLPNELLLHVFSFFSPRDLSRYAAPICRKWHELSHDPLLWQTLCFGFNPDVEPELLAQCMKQAPSVKRLFLNGRNTLTLADVECFVKYCPNLCHLDLGFCDNLTPTILYSFVRHCRKLEVINLEGCRGIDSKCVDVLCLASLLKDINLSYCIALADDSIKKLSSLLPVIRRLNIDGISFTTDSGCLELLTHHRNNLWILELDGAEQTDVSIEAISECPNLRKLSVSFALLLTDLSLQFISEMTSLRELKLRKGESFTSAALASFLTSPSLSNLTTLDLGECKELTDEGVFNLARNCGAKLRVLALCWCWLVTDQGLIAIVDNCRRLVELNLLGIDKICGSCLDRIPEEMPQLKFLDLRQCNRILDEIIEDMIKRKPDLKVLNYYGEEFISYLQFAT